MATQHTKGLSRLMIAPSVGLLLIWMIVPLAMTLWFSVQNYNLLNPGNVSFAGLLNYRFFYTDPAFFQSIWNTLFIVIGVLLITIVGGTAIALLVDQDIWGQGVGRIMIISLLRHAAGGGAGVEEHDHAPELWGARRSRPFPRIAADRLVRPISADRRRADRRRQWLPFAT